MTDHKTATSVHKRFADTVAGKAREIAGAITGNDELVEEGRLQREGARADESRITQEAREDRERLIDQKNAELEAEFRRLENHAEQERPCR
ncbi:MAG: hypothetical protein LLG14_07200 [Nocardiaceae bacterium]|nr:hypothetical protein [Nocardiaceae bacterium]